MPDTAGVIRQIATRPDLDSRTTLIQALLAAFKVARFAEVGVFRADLAAHLLAADPAISAYYAVDPWRNLDDWNKPFNISNDIFDTIFAEVSNRLAPFGDRVHLLRGKTTEVIDEVPDGSLDAVYIDGDHTLRGVSVDLIAWYPKLKDGGLLIGDDFSRTIWQHNPKFEPTLVFPFAVYFAEATANRIWSLPFNQFVLVKDGKRREFAFDDLAGKYGPLDLLSQIQNVPGRLSLPLPKFLRRRRRA